MDSDTRKRIPRAGGIVRWLKRAFECADKTTPRINCMTKDTTRKELTGDQVQMLRAKINHLEKLAIVLHHSDKDIKIPDTLLRDLKEIIAGQPEFAVLASLAIHEVMDSMPQSANHSGLALLLDQIQDMLQPIVAPSYNKPSKSRLLEAEPCMFWIFFGHCRSSTCHEKHEMPDLDKLLDMGIKRVPRWWLKEKIGLKGKYCVPWVVDGTCHSYTRSCDNIHAMPDGIRYVPNCLIEQRRGITEQDYCNFWIMNGYCAFSSYSCCYRHEMPDEKKLADIGIETTPRWWLERNDATRSVEKTASPRRLGTHLT